MNQKIAKQVAATSFGYVLDCILGYSDTGYDMGTDVSEFEQNFEEDLEELGIIPTNSKIEKIKKAFVKMQEGFEKQTRKKYYVNSYN